MGHGQPRTLIVASGGGHWEQMMLLAPAFEHVECLFVTTLDGLAEHFGIRNVRLVRDCNINTKLDTLICCAQLLTIVLRFRPKRIVTTGALPGLLAILAGKIVGARSLWIDSVANAESLSSAGRRAKQFADVHLSQWAHVARANQTGYAGRTL